MLPHMAGAGVVGPSSREAMSSQSAQLQQWKPSDRPSCEELLQEAWMQASGGSQGSQASPQMDAVAADSAQAAAAAPSQGGAVAADSAEAAAAAPSQGRALANTSAASLVAVAPPQGQGRWRFGAQVMVTTRSSLEKCVCSGHCYVPGHRYKGGCDSFILLSGSKYCRSCACSVYACARPR